MTLGKRSPVATRLIVGMVRLQNLIALMHWVQDCVRTNTDIDPASFNVETMLIANDHAESRETLASQTDVMSKIADPGKLKGSNSWEVWSMSFANLLSVIPARVFRPHMSSGKSPSQKTAKLCTTTSWRNVLLATPSKDRDS